MKTMTCCALALVLAAASGCDEKSEGSSAETKAAKGDGPKTTDQAGKKTDDPKTAPAPTKDDGPSADRDKEYFGLDMKPMGTWKTEFDADQHTAKWVREDSFSIMVRVENEKFDTVDDIKEEAPMMPQLGTAVTKVLEEKKTKVGFYAIVEREPGTKDLFYVRKFGASTVICSANLKQDELNPKVITKDEALAACESLSLEK